MRVTHGRRRRPRGRRQRARARRCCSCTGSAAPRRTSPTTSTRSAARHRVVTFDHRGHGESDSRPTRPRTRSTGSPPTRSRSPTRSASTRSGSSATRWAAWSPAGSCCAHPSGSTRSCSWTRRRAPSRARPRARRARRRDRARRGQGRAQADPRRGRHARDARRTSASSRERPGLRRSSTTCKWDALSRASMWATMRPRDRRASPTSSTRSPASRARRSSSSGEQDEPFLDASRAHGRRRSPAPSSS